MAAENESEITNLIGKIQDRLEKTESLQSAHNNSLNQAVGIVRIGFGVIGILIASLIALLVFVIAQQIEIHKGLTDVEKNTKSIVQLAEQITELQSSAKKLSETLGSYANTVKQSEDTIKSLVSTQTEFNKNQEKINNTISQFVDPKGQFYSQIRGILTGPDSELLRKLNELLEEVKKVSKK